MSLYDDASLILIPSGVKSGKIYSQKPMDSDGQFTFTRASEASRVNSAGLVEKVRTNSLLQSNDFDTTWAISSATVTGGQADKDGGTDAWILTTSVSGATITQNFSNTGVLSFSVYAKAGSVDGVRLRVDAAIDGDGYFNLSSGVVHSFSGSAIDASMSNIGDGWYRCEVAVNISTPVKVALYTTNGTTAYDSGSIYIQDSQLEQGLVSTQYIETTTVAVSEGPVANMPRLNSVAGGCPSLLLEPQRTNLLVQSEYFLSSQWVWAATTATITASPNPSPDGYANCYYVENVTGSQLGAVGPAVVGTTYTGSIYVRNISGSGSIDLRDINNASNLYTATSEWQRITATGVANSVNGRVYLNVLGVGSKVEVYGAQLEAASYATSYIPTYGTAATRVADDMDTTFASAFATDGGATFFIDIDAAPATGINSVAQNLAFNFSSGDYVTYNHSGGGYHRIRVNAGGTAYYQTGKLQQESRIKIAVKVSASSFSVFSNGSIDGSAVTISGDWASATDLITLINDNIGTIPLKQMLFFPTALSDTELATLTTL